MEIRITSAHSVQGTKQQKWTTAELYRFVAQALSLVIVLIIVLCTKAHKYASISRYVTTTRLVGYTRDSHCNGSEWEDFW